MVLRSKLRNSHAELINGVANKNVYPAALGPIPDSGTFSYSSEIWSFHSAEIK